MNDPFVLFAAGDVGPNRPHPDSIFEFVSPQIKEADIAFCQLEPVLSRRGEPLPQARLPMRTDPEAAAAIRKAGFHVVSFASNHCMDWGQTAFADTIKALHDNDLQVVGVGMNIVDARKPVIVERSGTRIAFLAYNSILPEGYWATEDRQGCAPLRAHTLYEQIETDQPGTPNRVLTFPHRGDMQHMIDDVHQAKMKADIVVVSMHWGIHFVPAVIADYQKELAYAAIDAGADLILGHHPHILKGIEIYKGKAIFYSLANFALESPFSFAEDLEKKASHQEIVALNPGFKPMSRKMPEDTLKTIAVQCYISERTIQQVQILPAMIDDQARPKFLAPGDRRFDDILQYLQQISENQGMYPEFTVNDGQVRLKL